MDHPQDLTLDQETSCQCVVYTLPDRLSPLIWSQRLGSFERGPLNNSNLKGYLLYLSLSQSLSPFTVLPVSTDIDSEWY